MKSAQAGKVMHPDVPKQEVARSLAAAFPEPLDENKCVYVKVPLSLSCSDLELIIWVPKKNQNIHTEALLNERQGHT